MGTVPEDLCVTALLDHVCMWFMEHLCQREVSFIPSSFLLAENLADFLGDHLIRSIISL